MLKFLLKLSLIVFALLFIAIVWGATVMFFAGLITGIIGFGALITALLTTAGYLAIGAITYLIGATGVTLGGC